MHPDWVYCEYNSIKDTEANGENFMEPSYKEQDNFQTPEEQLLHFLSRAGPGWKWMSVSYLFSFFMIVL